MRPRPTSRAARAGHRRAVLAGTAVAAGAALALGPLGVGAASASGAPHAATMTSATASGPLLVEGDRGPAVRQWQEQLDTWRERNGMGPIWTDGIFGPQTRAATVGFQQAAHIAVDGIVGPQTRAAMAAALAGRGVDRCTGAQLSVTETPSYAATGHSAELLHFANVGATPCTLVGYPGVAGLNAAGRQVVEAGRTPSGFLGGLAFGHTTPPTVELRPGDMATAVVEGTDIPVGHHTSCPELSGLLVTPPNTYRSVHLPYAPGDCTVVYVHPVIAGETGRAPGWN